MKSYLTLMMASLLFSNACARSDGVEPTRCWSLLYENGDLLSEEHVAELSRYLLDSIDTENYNYNFTGPAVTINIQNENSNAIIINVLHWLGQMGTVISFVNAEEIHGYVSYEISIEYSISNFAEKNNIDIQDCRERNPEWVAIYYGIDNSN